MFLSAAMMDLQWNTIHFFDSSWSVMQFRFIGGGEIERSFTDSDYGLLMASPLKRNCLLLGWEKGPEEKFHGKLINQDKQNCTLIVFVCKCILFYNINTEFLSTKCQVKHFFSHWIPPFSKLLFQHGNDDEE